jgi:hypothetical protein
MLALTQPSAASNDSAKLDSGKRALAEREVPINLPADATIGLWASSLPSVRREFPTTLLC